MKVANIILDIDGTLWNTTEVVAEAWKRAIAEEGYQDDIFVDASRLQSLFGKTMDVIADALFQRILRRGFWINAANMSSRHWKVRS